MDVIENTVALQLQKETIERCLRERGCRITKQRRILLDVILDENVSCCKEIYYKASKKDKKIGVATVYRMINLLEDIGAVSRGNLYKIEQAKNVHMNACRIELKDNSVIEVSLERWNQIVQAGLTACGYIDGQEIRRVIPKRV
ncbi:MAG: transcriptional repressor [Eubacteriales bacterium]|nr:transcriptional repressor [Eubacteriales bacterium]